MEKKNSDKIEELFEKRPQPAFELDPNKAKEFFEQCNKRRCNKLKELGRNDNT